MEQEFRDAMSRFASGVTVVTTVDAEGVPRGYTASAFTSLSLDPPMVLTTLAGTAESHPAFVTADTFAVSVLRPHHHEIAMRFASKGTDKFAGDDFTPGRLGLPVLPDALAVVECRIEALFPGGDHTIITGRVEHVWSHEGPALVYFMREFFELAGPMPAPVL